MNWIIGSLISLVFFVLANILIKVNGRANVPSAVINLATYSVGVWAFLIAGKGNSFGMPSPAGLLLIILSAVCVYVGNAASVRGFNRAPNPGYSQVIVKSYAATTVIASILLFGGEFAWQKMAGIAFILAGQLLIVPGKTRRSSDGSPHWTRFSFIAFLAYSILSIAVKYATVDFGMNQMVFLFWAVFIALFFFAAEIGFKKISIQNYRKQTGALFLTGIFSGIANVLMWNAFIEAPNMGYVNAINVAGIAFVTLLSVKLFGDELTRKKALGIAGVIAGLLLIVLK